MNADKNAPQPMNNVQRAMLDALVIKHRILKQEFATTVGVKRYYERMYNAVNDLETDEQIGLAIDAVLNDIMIAAERQRRLDRTFVTYDLLNERLTLVLKRQGELVAALEDVALTPYVEAVQRNAATFTQDA
jgi:hypothetical protein